MKKHKWFIATILIAFAIPLVFWWGVDRGNEIDSMVTAHGYELIRLQKDIQKLQLHIAELAVENHKLRVRIYNNQHKNGVLENALEAYRDK